MWAACLLLATLYNSALFAGHGEIAVGRAWVEDRRLEALIVTAQGAYTLGDPDTDEGLYGLAPISDGYVAVGFSGEQALLLYLNRNGSLRSAQRAGPGILWFTDGRFAVGGLKGPDWDVWVLHLADGQGYRYPAPGDAYAYGAYFADEKLQVVGRTTGAGGFDAFWLQLSPQTGKIEGYQSHFPGNDYLRFVGPLGAVGRAEVKADSEGLWLWPQRQQGELWRRPGFDYFRMLRDFSDSRRVLVGEAEVEGERRGLWLEQKLNTIWQAQALKMGLGSLRFLDALQVRAYGFSYGQSPEGQGWVSGGEEPGVALSYQVEPLMLNPLPLPWEAESVHLAWQPLGGIQWTTAVFQGC